MLRRKRDIRPFWDEGLSERPGEGPEEFGDPADLVRLFALAQARWHSTQPLLMFAPDDFLRRARRNVWRIDGEPEVALGPFRVWPPPPIWEPDVLVGAEMGVSRFEPCDPTPNAWWREEPEPKEAIQMRTFTVVARPQYGGRFGRKSSSEWEELAQAVIATAESGKAVRIEFESRLHLGRARQRCYMRCHKAGVSFRSTLTGAGGLIADFWAEKKRGVQPIPDTTGPHTSSSREAGD